MIAITVACYKQLFWISQKPNLTMLFYTLNETKESHVFASSLTASKTKRANLTSLPLEIMDRGHTWHYYSWAWVSLIWLLYNLQLWHHRHWFRKFTVRFRPIRKEIVIPNLKVACDLSLAHPTAGSETRQCYPLHGGSKDRKSGIVWGLWCSQMIT